MAKKTKKVVEARVEKQSEESMISKAVREALSEALPLAAAMATKAAQTARTAPPVPVPSRKTCGECRQQLVACGGKHRKVVAYPNDTQYGQFFQGWKLNGVTYLSNGPGHYVIVPEECNIEYAIAQWEENEKIQANGRQRNHNSGVMGPGHSNINRADYAGWR